MAVLEVEIHQPLPYLKIHAVGMDWVMGWATVDKEEYGAWRTRSGLPLDAALHRRALFFCFRSCQRLVV